MNELLKINYEAEQPTVSARDLHEALGVASRFSRWFDSNKELFVEGEDYNKCTSSTVVNNGARMVVTKSRREGDRYHRPCITSGSNPDQPIWKDH